MKIIIDKNNPITVVDQEGNVMFDWNPNEPLRHVKELVMKPMSEEDKKYIYEQLKIERDSNDFVKWSDIRVSN